MATVTEIYDYLRLLYARVGVPYSPATGLPIESQTVPQMVDRVLALPEGSRVYLLAPIVRGRKGEYRKELLDLQRKGFQRVKIDGTLCDIEDAPALDKKLKHDIEVVVDRIVTAADLGQRLADSVETAVGLSDGLLVVEDAETGARQLLSAKFACPVSGFTIAEIEPRLFSFNSPHGACPACDGLGRTMFMDPDLVVPDPDLSLAEGAIEPWADSTSTWYPQTLASLAKHYGFDLATPWRKLPEKARDAVLNGSGREAITMRYADGLRAYETKKPFEGVVTNLQRRWRETDSAWMRDELSEYLSSAPCHELPRLRGSSPRPCASRSTGLPHKRGYRAVRCGDADRAWFEALPDERLTARSRTR